MALASSSRDSTPLRSTTEWSRTASVRLATITSEAPFAGGAPPRALAPNVMASVASPDVV